MAQPTEAVEEASPEVSLGRRRLLRGAAGASPVILSLVSRPVIGQTCNTASAYGSGNASRPGVQTCTGRSPATWASSNDWPSSYGKGKPFNNVFTAGGYAQNTSLSQVITMTGGVGKDALAPYIVAALLNAAKNATWVPVLDVEKVQAIWTEYRSKGYFTPTAGIQWNANQIVDWLKTTMA